MTPLSPIKVLETLVTTQNDNIDSFTGVKATFTPHTTGRARMTHVPEM